MNQQDEPDSRGYYRRMQSAIEELLILKGVFTGADVEREVEAMDSRDPGRRAKMVARAWVDPAFKARAIQNGSAAAEELGFAVGPLRLIVLENTPRVHNVIVCTLCSCYPYELLGNPPWWYKHDSYKEAIVREPRKTLGEMFKLSVPGEVEVRVVDSTSDVRYMVMPKRPEGSDGLGEEELAKLVTQDSLIGVGETVNPNSAGVG